METGQITGPRRLILREKNTGNVGLDPEAMGEEDLGRTLIVFSPTCCTNRQSAAPAVAGEEIKTGHSRAQIPYLIYQSYPRALVYPRKLDPVGNLMPNSIVSR